MVKAAEPSTTKPPRPSLIFSDAILVKIWWAPYRIAAMTAYQNQSFIDFPLLSALIDWFPGERLAQAGPDAKGRLKIPEGAIRHNRVVEGGAGERGAVGGGVVKI